MSPVSDLWHWLCCRANPFAWSNGSEGESASAGAERGWRTNNEKPRSGKQKPNTIYKRANLMFRNKFNLRNVVAIAICLAVTTMFSGCNEEGGDPGDKTSNVKVVSGISMSWKDAGFVNANTTFNYDDQDRVIEIADHPFFMIGKKTTFTYAANEVKMTARFTGYHDTEDGSSSEWDGEVDYTAQLDENGSIKSATSIWKNSRESKETVVSCTASYSNGLISQIIYSYDEDIASKRTTKFTWSNGNLVKIEMEKSDDRYSTINISYDHSLENSITNLDINWSVNVRYWMLDDLIEPILLPQFGFFGKRSKNLIKSVNVGGETYNYQYNLNNDGVLSHCYINDDIVFEFAYK